MGLQHADKENLKAKSQVKSDGEKHETAESNLNRRTQEHEDKKKTVEKLEKEVASMKKANGDSINQVNEQKVVLEKENKEATLKIIKLQDENVKLQAKLNDDVQDLN